MPDVFGEISASPSPAQVTRYAPPDGFERNDLFLSQTRHFIRVAKGKDEPICNLTDGIRVQQVVEAAHQSNRQGKRIAI
jgi:predicted dehydrogenase